MNLDSAIERQRRPLLRIVATMFAMVGLVEGARVERLATPVYRAVLRLLRPAESAVRRLIVAASHGLTLTPPRPRSSSRPLARDARKGPSRASFRLFDPRPRFSSAFAFERPKRVGIKRVRRPEPRIHVLDVGFDPRIPLFRQAAVSASPAPPPAPPVEEGSVSGVHLSRRLAAIKCALDDLPRQARRYLRWQARPVADRRPCHASALRPGKPPGHRKHPTHAVDQILEECDWLARQSRLPDTS